MFVLYSIFYSKPLKVVNKENGWLGFAIKKESVWFLGTTLLVLLRWVIVFPVPPLKRTWSCLALPCGKGSWNRGIRNSLSNHGSQLVDSFKPFWCQTPGVFNILQEIPCYFKDALLEVPSQLVVWVVSRKKRMWNQQCWVLDEFRF